MAKNKAKAKAKAKDKDKAKKAKVTLKVDPILQEQAEVLFCYLGLDMSTAYSLFLNQCLRCNGLPFAVRLEPNAETLAALEEAERGENMYGPFCSVDELMEALAAVNLEDCKKKKKKKKKKD